eukprot:COSAG02_NODE_1702_length_11245_cov_6.015432_8_plen_1458_part_00
MCACTEMFVAEDEISVMADVTAGQPMTGDLPSSEARSSQDIGRLAVRRTFELEGVAEEYSKGQYKEIIDEIFNKSTQTLVYRGFSDDPRNTNEAWVETTAWHVHCPATADLTQFLDGGKSKRSAAEVCWMDVIVTTKSVSADTNARLEVQDANGNRCDLFARHRDLIELGVFGNVLGNRDMPFEYNGVNEEPEGDRSEIVTLNENHSHYLLCDNGTRGRFGVEISFRAELEIFMSCYNADARRMSIENLTEYFCNCIDESDLHINDTPCEIGSPSLPIKLDTELTPISVVRTASDGATKRTYSIIVKKHSKRAVAISRNESVDWSTKTTDSLVDQNQNVVASSSVFSLNGSDITSLSVRDANGGEVDYYPEEAFDPSVTTYTVVVPASVDSVTVKPSIQAAQKKCIYRTIPIVMLCYGGGPQTLRLLNSVGSTPIIIVRGSSRSAQFIESWTEMEAAKFEHRTNPEAVMQLTRQQRKQAKYELRADFASVQRPPTTYRDVVALPEKPAWWNVDSYLDALQKLAAHEHLHFFDINQTTTVRTKKKVRLNPLLPPLLDSIVKSTQVMDSVKLPLAIRLNDEKDVKTLCSRQGIAMGIGETDITRDSRLLIFAAFHDRGRVAERLLETGFDVSQLDQLIVVELQRMLDEPKLIQSNSPPVWWIKSQFNQEDADPHLIAARWRKTADKKTVCRHIDWNMLPSLAGWTFLVKTTEQQGNRDDTMASMVVEQLSCTYAEGQFPPCGLMKRKFAVISPESEKGNVMVATDEFVQTQGDDNLVKCIFLEGISRTDKRQANEQPTVVHAVLTPIFKDNVTEWLPLHSEVKFRFPRFASTERKNVAQAFENWLAPLDGGGSSSSAVLDPNRPMHDLHRLYWAIRSNRPKMANMLMRRCHLPIVAGLFSSYLYQTQRLPRNYIPDANLKRSYRPENMKTTAEAYACDILDNAELSGSNAAFDEFLFYPLTSETDPSSGFAEFVPKKRDQIANANLRSALVLMNVDQDSQVTNIDLALKAESKLFMSQAGVTQFLRMLWLRPSDNGSFVQQQMPEWTRLSRPSVKGLLKIIGFAAFIILYATFLASVPKRGDAMGLTGTESAFWIWTLAFIINEIVEARDDFDSVLQYLQGSGNAVDCVIILFFAAALLCRLFAAAQTASVGLNDDLSTHHGLDSSSSIGRHIAADLLIGLLCCNLILCCLRMLMLLSMIRRVGVMVIIAKRIIQQDILPFLVFATLTVAAFECSAFFFSWVLQDVYYPGSLFMFFTGVGDFKSASLQTSPSYLPWWDEEVYPGRTAVWWMATGFQFVFFVLTIVILMNLLIAMMADTFSSVASNAEAEYQMQFAKLVKECYESTVFPVPLNVLEHAINSIVEFKRQSRQRHGQRLAVVTNADTNTTAEGIIDSEEAKFRWGKHYGWPVSSLPFSLEMAMRNVVVRQEIDKAKAKAGANLVSTIPIRASSHGNGPQGSA